MKITLGTVKLNQSDDLGLVFNDALNKSTKEVMAFITENAQKNAPTVRGETEEEKNKLKNSIRFTEPDIDTHSSRIKVDYENAVRYHEDPTFVTGNINKSGNMEGPKFVERAYTDNLRQIIDFFKEFITTYVTSRREVRMNTVKSVTDLMTTEK
jgi:hypothetical protein